MATIAKRPYVDPAAKTATSGGRVQGAVAPSRALIGDLRKGILPAAVLIVLVIVWELLDRITPHVFQVIPAPSAIFDAMISGYQTLLTRDIPQTLTETLIGLAVAVALGVGIAALLDYVPLLKRALYPLLVISQTIPIFALAVVLILVFGFDILPKVIVVIVFCFFPIAVSTMDGLTATDPDLVALLRAMGASNVQIWRKVRFPAALPAFFSGLRIAATYSITGAIVGEYITSNSGLGHLLRLAFNQGNNAQAFVAIVITAALSIALVVIVSIAERIALPWYFTEAREWIEPGIY